MLSKLNFCCTVVFLIVCLFIFLSDTIALNYCGSNVCDNSKQHTLCRFRTPGPGPNCFGYQKTVTTEEQKNALLDKINNRRNKIAAGEVRSFPAAENMMKLEWNEDLELSAQRWADQCVAQGVSDIKDACRDLVNVAVGQNIASVYGEAPGLSPLSLVDVWYMELLNTNSSVLPRYLPSIQKGLPHYDYFTQLVWARSSDVGCGGVKFQERLKDTRVARNRTVHRLVCNFAPGGNTLGDTVYSGGPPCSRCPDGGICDLDYNALCSTLLHRNTRFAMTKDEKENAASQANTDDQFILSDDELPKENKTSISEAPTNTEAMEDDENITLFDYFSHLYELTREPVTIATTKVTNHCKDALAVDEFVELLKKKLTSDSTFKELLLSTKNPQNVDPSFSDPSVAAFVSRIYSKKEPSTTTKLPEYDYVNSTLLVDLVEAVIFRSADKTYATEETIEALQPSSVGPVKIQAELGEVKPNHDFTGHYFFPEDFNEESVSEATDLYYDSSNIPVSDVISEIESLKRDKTTQDFLDEIIDSDSGIDESNLERRKRKSDAQYLENLYIFDNNDYNTDRQARKTKVMAYSCDYEDENIEVKYDDLLRKIAADLKLLKLNDRFHCSCSGAMETNILLIDVLIFCYLIHLSFD